MTQSSAFTIKLILLFTLLFTICYGGSSLINTLFPRETFSPALGAIDNSKKEAKDLRYCFHATIPNLCHVPKHAYK